MTRIVREDVVLKGDSKVINWNQVQQHKRTQL